MDEGVVGAAYTVTDRAEPVKQAVPALTVTDPLVKFAGKVAVIEVVPCPWLITTPAGTVQV
jgi:hypothetical protein